MPLKFEWNPDKARKIIKNHKVSFDEAATVFSDPLPITYNDPDHSYSENRYIKSEFPFLETFYLFPIRKQKIESELLVQEN